MAQRIWKLVGVPLVILGLFVSLYALWLILDLPPPEELVPVVKTYFDQYGILAVFGSAIIEGLLVIGWYFPGTLVLILGLLLAGGDIARTVEVAAVAIGGLCISYVLNFLAGKYGWYRVFIAFGLREPLERAQQRLRKYGLSAIFMTYWHINIASIVSTAAGVLQFSFVGFLACTILATVVWIGFWAGLIYVFKDAAMALVNLRLMMIIITGWIVLRLIWGQIDARLKARRSRAGDSVPKSL